MKRILAIFALLLLFAIPVGAQEDIYKEQYDASGAASLEELLPEETRERLEAAGIDSADPDWNEKLTPSNLFSQIWGFLREGGRRPLRAGAAVLGVILLTAAFSSMADKGQLEGTISFVSCLAVASAALLPLFSLIQSCIAAIKGCSVFLLSFVPIYAGILVMGGKTATAATFSTLLLAAAEAVLQLASFLIVPLMGAYLAVSLSSSVSPLSKTAKLGELIKKIALWVLALVLTLFLGVLSLQTTIGAAGDNIGLKATKFVLGSTVPVVGTALSEALTTLGGCMTLLKSSVGMYGVVALVAILLPVILELLLWRAVLLGSNAVCDLLGVGRVGEILRAADSVVSVLVGVLLFIGALFILSLTVVLKAGGTI